MKWHRVKFSTGGLYADDSFDLWTEIHCFFEKKKKTLMVLDQISLGHLNRFPFNKFG